MKAALIALFKAFFAICLLRKGPQDLPSSHLFATICLLIYGLSSLLVELTTAGTGEAGISVLVELLLTLLLTYGLLSLARKPERWLQTITALMGTGTLFSFMVIPLLVLMDRIKDTEPAAAPVSLLIILLIVWNIIVMAHIIRHALSVIFPAGVLIAFAYIWIITSTITMLSSQQVM